MKTRSIKLLALLLLLGSSGLAAATEVDTAPQVVAEASADAPKATEDRDRIAWQRVGSPEIQES